jgi:hypothetical protein
MTRQVLLCGLLVAGVSISAAGDDKHNHPVPAAPTNAGLEKMKTLVGRGLPLTKMESRPMKWFHRQDDSRGSAVHETLFPGQPHEMISVYTADGSDVVMTHYCVLGNQPRLKASTKSLGNKLKFEFAGGSNLDPKKDKHMHAATLIFVDPDHLEVEGKIAHQRVCNGMSSSAKNRPRGSASHRPGRWRAHRLDHLPTAGPGAAPGSAA